MKFTSPFSRPNAIGINDPVEYTFYNGQFNPIKDALDDMSNIQAHQTAVNYTIPSNTIAYLEVDCSGGARTITLPDCANQTTAIAIKKIDETFNPVNIVRQGADFIEGLGTYEINPTATQISPWLPNSCVWLVPFGTRYRLLNYYYNASRIAIRARRSANISLTPNAWTNIVFDTITGDINYALVSGVYNTTNGIFTAPGPGLYQVAGGVRTQPQTGGAGFFVNYRYQIAGNAFLGAGLPLNPTSSNGQWALPLQTVRPNLATGETVNMQYQLAAGSTAVLFGAIDCGISIHLIRPNLL